MHICNPDEAAYSAVSQAGAEGCRMRELITDREGAPTFAMRQFVVQPGGHTPQHEHEWEHEVYVLAGSGEVVTAEGARELAPGDAVLVLPNETHSFRNTGQGEFRFLCLIPVQQACCR